MLNRDLTEMARKGSAIRAMFEEGNRLRSEFGAENVYDFSLGNPDLPVEPELTRTLLESAAEKRHGYMSNTGFVEAREKVAREHSALSGVAVRADGVVMTVGAAGALNITLRALLNPGDEVILFQPYFGEYLNYIRTWGGQPVICPAGRDFIPDLNQLEALITPRTQAVIMNSPNNPSGVVYPEAWLREFAALLSAQDHPIYLISDEPYVEIVYDGVTVPSVLAHYENTIICYSWSKKLSIPGERIGYALVHPGAADYGDLMGNLAVAMRNGYVNAPAIWQLTMTRLPDLKPNVEAYRRRRDALLLVLEDAGLDCTVPQGAFYLFPSTPIPDDAFVRLAAEEHILLVGGSGFGMKNHVRLAYCVSDETIQRSAPAFRRLMDRIRA